MEVPIQKAKALFVGKTIAKVDLRCDNNLEFLFGDGTKVALHIDCDAMNLPVVVACTHCVEIAA